MKTVFTATQIHDYSNNSYFQKIRLHLENPGKLFSFPRSKFPLKPSGIPGGKPYVACNKTYKEKKTAEKNNA